MQKVITDDLDALIDILPEHIRKVLNEQSDIERVGRGGSRPGTTSGGSLFPPGNGISSSRYYRAGSGIYRFPHQAALVKTTVLESNALCIAFLLSATVKGPLSV